ncbi:threonine/serine exporter family protein [Clostridiaceae bacterium M8S5]|nr:threonine/serine exporter family protein [Clostridiaceae bacterium M8S5]
MTEQEKKEILRIALYAGEIILANGGETYRTEETINMICKSKNMKHVNSFVTPTGLFISDDRLDGISFIKRVKNRTNNLDKIAKVNNFSRQFVNGEIKQSEAIEILNGINNEQKYPELIRIVSTGLASAFFSLLFGANIIEFIVAFVAGVVGIFVNWKIERVSNTSFLANMVSGAITACIVIVTKKLHIVNNIDVIIVGGIMPLVPGVALNNGLRDFISGDLVAGITRVAEAVMIAISIAAGVGAVLKLSVYITGGVI